MSDVGSKLYDFKKVCPIFKGEKKTTKKLKIKFNNEITKKKGVCRGYT